MNRATTEEEDEGEEAVSTVVMGSSEGKINDEKLARELCFLVRIAARCQNVVM